MPMTTSEPTEKKHSTKQIIDWFRYYGTEVDVIAADRLESQEQTIKEQEYQLELLSLGIPVQMKELTARAEQAEAREGAVIKQNIAWQNELLEKVKEITDSLRGLPQDGEGK